MLFRMQLIHYFLKMYDLPNTRSSETLIVIRKVMNEIHAVRKMFICRSIVFDIQFVPQFLLFYSKNLRSIQWIKSSSNLVHDAEICERNCKSFSFLSVNTNNSFTKYKSLCCTIDARELPNLALKRNGSTLVGS